MPITPQQAQAAFEGAECLYTNTQVHAALDQLAEAITGELAQQNPLVLCVMTGALIPAGQLLTRLNFPLQIDYLHATRYNQGTSGGRLQWLARPKTSLAGRCVLIVDDILDEGATLAAISEDCWSQGAHDVYIAVLVNKLHDRKADIKADFVGLEVPDRYVFGYGMDYKGYLRNAPGIYAINE